ncbi:InlB B-repeat-containing protein [Paenibacillus sp. J5C_2022]|nr:InlB B-repeat-containing protein [Paenibacillus sp. J5C2022]
MAVSIPQYAWAAAIKVETVGSAGFSADTAYETSIAVDGSGTPYVVYQDGGNSYKATVVKYVNGNWETVGHAGFSAGPVFGASIALDSSGTPFVVYSDGLNSSKATVMKFENSSWVPVGNEGFSAGSVASTSIAIDSIGTLYVVYLDGANSNKTTVMTFQNDSWAAVGSAGFSADWANDPSIALDNGGTPYVAYQDGGNSSKATVMKFENGNWATVGDAGFSADTAAYTSIAIDGSGIPYVVYQDGGNTSKATVMKFVNGNWAPVGDAGFSAGEAVHTSIAIDGTGTPYVAFQDIDNSNKATVMIYANDGWMPLGNTGFSADEAMDPSIAIDSSGIPYVVYTDGEQSDKATVVRYVLVPTYTVTYDDNGATNGSVPTDSRTYAQGDTVSVYDNVGSLTNTGFTFTGWDTVTGTTYAAGDTFTMDNANVTLYAKWTINNYTVTFDKNGGDSAATPAAKTVTHGGTVGSLPTPPARAGYTFSGWNTQADGNGTTFDAATAITNDMTVYAKWTMTSYTVTFDKNGGDSAATPAAKTVAYGDTVGSLPTPPTRTGYAFSGWNTQSDGNGTTFNAATAVTSDITLYAKWISLWQPLGNTGFTAGSANYTSIAIDGNGTPYVVYQDGGNSNKATVMKFVNGSWATVGSAGFSAGKAEYTSIAIDSNGTPYVAYQDGGSSSKATVMKFASGNWEPVGSAGFSAGKAEYTSIAIDSSGTPYVAYQDGGNSGKATVMKFANGSWATVGNAGFSAHWAWYTSIAIDSNGTPYVVYRDFDSSYKATVMKFVNGSWATVGGEGFSAEDAWYTSIAIDSSGTPYVVYWEISDSYKATVMKFANNNWTMVGGAGFSAGSASYTSIAIDSYGTPYVVYRDGGNGDKATLMKYANGSWATVGFSAGSASYTSIAIDGSGTPYVVYQDGSNLNKATVMKYGLMTQVSSDPVSIAIPAGVTGAKIAVTTTTAGSNKEATLPLVEVQAATSSGNVSVTIPAGAKVTANSNWDGTIKLPQVLSNDSVSVNNGNVDAVIEVGSSDVSLTFDKAVRLLIPNKGGKKACFKRTGDTTCTPITRTISTDTQAAADSEIAAGGEAAITVGSDLVIWTKHFTKFAAYTPVSPPTVSGGGGSAPSNSFTIKAFSSAEFTLNGVTLTLPEGASDKTIQVTVDKVANIAHLPQDASLQLLGDVYEVKKNSDGDFIKPVTITLPFDSSKVDLNANEVAVYWLNEQTNQWVKLDNAKADEASGTVSGTIMHFTKFAVLRSELKQTPSPSENESNLTDIKGHWAEADIRELIELGAISGYPNQTFKPNSPITRAQFVSILVKALKLTAPSSRSFDDTTGHWAKDAIGTAAALRIISGFEDHTFRPNDMITREQMAVIVVRALKLPASSTSISFTDNSSVSSWAMEAVATAAEKELMNGYTDGTFKAKINTTRAEAATVILKAINLEQ